MEACGVPLKLLPIEINYGIKTGFNDAFYIDSETRGRLIAEDPRSAELIYPLLRGRDITAWYSKHEFYIINSHNGIKEKNISPVYIEKYPAVKSHLEQYINELKKRGDKGKTPYHLRNCAYLEEFSKPKIVYPNMTSVFPFSYDECGCVSNDKSFILTSKGDCSLKSLLAIFNSKLCKLWIWYNCPELQGGTREIRKVYFENFPVVVDVNAKALEALADAQISANEAFRKYVQRFQNRVQSTLGVQKMTEKLSAFYKYAFGVFLDELKKQKVKLSLCEQDEWEEYFNGCRQDCTRLLLEIDENDRKIDQLVYELYGLTEEEIAVIESDFQVLKL